MEEKTKDLPQVAKDLYLHAVVIHKPVRLGEARELSQQIIKDKDKTLYRETEDSFRFRNIPKDKFSSFVTKKIDEKVSIILGHLKIDD